MENRKTESDNRGVLLYSAWFVSLAATLGSLYFSEIKEFIPCELCWYQRIAMYPLVSILGIATFRNDVKAFIYVLPLSLIGGTISILHYLEQKVPGFGGFKPCVNGVPCSSEYINWLGFVTIPFLALVAFTLIAAAMIILLVKNKSN
ncbi:disulfide bond formation protein B [Planococcus sp. CP5-4]|uniref:disulfide oxidoreductase n=1 Tax=unclassified Planococcus (in: firmicutes) TaxID=2662419 RepID=UPI001C246196|nr:MULTISPECIES: disulfide oxidoreductase [unclassified Planococcus (in: firmicutes)]MBU9673373.1 disulfide bond formation protein B [Planococcus sp. CP5-4_YE]MBV0908146.1 disulfide bond formation protein B [Planococcus sp. CP5-4_UN]MBW6062207.1 disulfide bond formation protein B [Planococcus sp. CP5-4]